MAGIFRFLLKAGLVAFLCLTAYLWVQRKNIATTLIQHELWKLEIYDLDFRVGELSPFSFELRDVLWGRPDSPFLYLSSVKIHYSPQGLYAGRVDKVAVGRFETQLAFDEQNKPQSELINRVLLAVNRVKQKYPQDQSGAERKPMVMPELTLDRGTLNIAGSEAFPLKGRIDVSTELSQVSNRVDLMGEFVLPQGRTGFKGALDLVSLDINSSLSAKITAGIDVVDLVDPSLGVNMRAVELTGDLFVNGLDGSPEWNLKLQIPSQPCLADNETFSFTSSLMGVGEFAGSVTNVCGNGSFGLAAPVLDIKGAVDRPEISNGCERVYFDFKLPETAFDQMDSSVLVCNAGVSNLNSLAGDLFSLRGGYVESHFNLSVGEGIHFDDSVLDWDDCLVNGLKLLPGELELSVSNEFVCMQTSVSVADEPLKMMFDLAMPLKNPQSGTLKIEMPPAKIDNSGRLGKLIRKKSGQRFDFSGMLSASVNVDGLYPGAAVTGAVKLAEGTYHKDEIELTGISMYMPFKWAGAAQSTGEPVVRIESLKAGNIVMGPGKILFQLTDRELFVERAQMAWAKGFLHAYAIHAGLDGNIRNEFVVYADKVDLGEVFMLVMPFDGKMEGVLYGRFPVILKKKRVELSGGYLYSLPDQGGMLKLNDPSQMEALLIRAGIPDDREKSLSNALSDLDLTAIRLDLVPGLGEDSSLRIKLHGKSNYKKRPAPVNLNLNLNGQLQQLLNLGMDLQGLK